MATLNINQAYTYTANASAPSPYNGPFTYQWAFDGVNAGTASTQAKTWTSLGTHTTACTVTNSATGEAKQAYETDTVIGSGSGSTTTASGYRPGLSVGNTGELIMTPEAGQIVGPVTTNGLGFPNTSWPGTSPAFPVVSYTIASDTFTNSTSTFNIARDTTSSTNNASIAINTGTGKVWMLFAGATGWAKKAFSFDLTARTLTALNNHPSTAALSSTYGGIISILGYNNMLLPSGKIFTLQNQGAPTTATWLYDPSNDTYTPSVAIPDANYSADSVNPQCAVDSTTGYVYAYISRDYATGTDTGKVYRWKEGDLSWTLVGTHPTPKEYPGVAAASGKVLIFCGGAAGTGAATNTVHVLDAGTGVWTQLGNWPETARYPTVPVLNGTKAYFWGYTGNRNYAGYYDMTWAASTAPQTVTLANSKRVVGNSLVFTGGYVYSMGGVVRDAGDTNDVFANTALSLYLP